MKRMLTISALVVATAFSTPVLAGGNDAVLGAMVGGGAGALIGHSINGRDGALIGGALGAFTGVALTSSDHGRERTVVYGQAVSEREEYEPERVVVRRYEPRRVVVIDRYDDRGYGRGGDRVYGYGYGYDRGYGHRHGWNKSWASEDNDRGYNCGRDDRGDRDDDRGDRWH